MLLISPSSLHAPQTPAEVNHNIDLPSSINIAAAWPSRVKFGDGNNICLQRVPPLHRMDLLPRRFIRWPKKGLSIWLAPQPFRDSQHNIWRAYTRTVSATAVSVWATSGGGRGQRLRFLGGASCEYSSIDAFFLWSCITSPILCVSRCGCWARAFNN